MSKINLYKILALGLIILSVSCDKVCKSTSYDFANVQNMTGRQLTLNVCKGNSYGEVQTTVLISGASQEVSLGSREESDIQGGLDAAKSCSKSDSKTEMRMSLSPTSFGQVKLCYDEISKVNVLVENNQACPATFLEQTSASPCI